MNEKKFLELVKEALDIDVENATLDEEFIDMVERKVEERIRMAQGINFILLSYLNLIMMYIKFYVDLFKGGDTWKR